MINARVAGEVLLAVSAVTFSLPGTYKLAATLIGALALLAGGPRASLRCPFTIAVFAPLAAGIALSLALGASPGPSVESAGILIAGGAFFMLGRPSPAKGAADGRVSACAGGILAVAGIISFANHGSPPQLWFYSPIDFGVATLLLGLFGSQSFRPDFTKTLYLGTILLSTATSTSRALVLAGGVAAWGLLRGVRARGTIVLISLAAVPLIISRIEADPLAWNRGRIYAAAANLTLERPWTGWGLGAFDAVSRRALLPDPLPIRHMRIPVYAHSDPIELIFEIGIPLATACFAAFFLACFVLRRREPHRAAVMTASMLLSLFHFPLHQSFPLFMTFFAAGGGARACGPHPNALRRVASVLIALPFLAAAAGLAFRFPSLTPYDARLALESAPGPGTVMKMAELEPERPESHRNLAILASSTGGGGAAIRHLAGAVARAPNEIAHRIALARAALAYASVKTDSAAASKWRNFARHNLLYAGAVEPLFLHPYLMKGDTLGFEIANASLDRAGRTTEPPNHVLQMRERL